TAPNLYLFNACLGEVHKHFSRNGCDNVIDSHNQRNSKPLKKRKRSTHVITTCFYLVLPLSNEKASSKKLAWLSDPRNKSVSSAKRSWALSSSPIHANLFNSKDSV